MKTLSSVGRFWQALTEIWFFNPVFPIFRIRSFASFRCIHSSGHRPDTTGYVLFRIVSMERTFEENERRNTEISRDFNRELMMLATKRIIVIPAVKWTTASMDNTVIYILTFFLPNEWNVSMRFIWLSCKWEKDLFHWKLTLFKNCMRGLYSCVTEVFPQF